MLPYGAAPPTAAPLKSSAVSAMCTWPLLETLISDDLPVASVLTPSEMAEVFLPPFLNKPVTIFLASNTPTVWRFSPTSPPCSET